MKSSGDDSEGAGTVPPAPNAAEPAPDRLVGSDSWYRALAKRTGDVFFALRTHPDFAVEFVSETVNGWGGYRTEDYMADPQLLIRILDPEHAEQMTAALSAELEEDVEFELKWRHRDGRPIWTQNRGRRRAREDGSIVLEGTTHDITPLRMTQRELEESEERLKLVLDNVSDALLQFAADGTLLWASQSLESIAGWNPADVVGTRFRAFADVDRDEVDAVFQQAIREHRKEFRHRSRVNRQDGQIIWISNSARILWADDGSLDGVVCSVRDVTELVEAENRLAASQEQYRHLAEESSDFTLRTTDNFVVDWVSPSVTRVLGWRPEEIVGRVAFDLLHPHDVAGTRESAQSMHSGRSASGRIRLRTADGSYRWMSQVSTPVFDDQGALVARVSGFQDVDEVVRTEQELARSERRFRMAIEFAPTGMAVVDLQRGFTEVNPALCRLVGRDEDWLLAHGVANIIDPADDGLDLRMRAQVLAGDCDTAQQEKRLVRADGARIWVEHSVSLLRDEDGAPVSFVSQFLDVTESHQAQERLRFIADHDTLTSLPNRHQLLVRIGDFLSHPTLTSGSRLAILFVDLDRFKPINDTYGHAVGDAVLVEVARRISAQVRADDIVARLGGDEFIVALPAVRGVADAQTVAAKVHRAFHQPLRIDDRSLPVTVSIGLTLAEPGEDKDLVLQRADQALYRAKGEGRNRTAHLTATDKIRHQDPPD